MQPHKYTNKNSDLEILTSDSDKLVNSLTDVMNKFNMKSNLMIFDFLKCKGFAVSSLLNILIILPFYGIANIYQLMRCGINSLNINGQKDVFYDIKNNEFIDWRKLLQLHVRRFRYLINKTIDIKSIKTTAFIFDDTLLEKTGRKIEKISSVYDHVNSRYVFGYKLLVCGFWDGDSFIPLDFTLHREKGKKQEEYIKNYHTAIKQVEKQKITVSKTQLNLNKNQQKLTINFKKYTNKQNKANTLYYSKSKLKVENLESQIVESQKLLNQYEKEKIQAYKELKRYYSKGRMFGLSTKERESQFKKAVNTKSHGFIRRKEADKDKIVSMLEMICRLVKQGILPNYVLVDSWFFCYDLLEKLRVLKKGAIKLVSLVKINNQIFTICQTNKEMSVKNIIKKYEGESKKCKKMKANYIRLNCYYKGIRVNLFFVRMGKCKTWHLLLTTDLELSFTKVMEIYQIRWSIEVFFKESKQYLNLGNCQSNTFDAQIADITISMMQHIMLNYFKRIHYQQSIGALFIGLRKEITEMDLVSRLIAIFWELIELLSDSNGIDFIEFQCSIMRNEEIMVKFIKLIPEKISNKAA